MNTRIYNSEEDRIGMKMECLTKAKLNLYNLCITDSDSSQHPAYDLLSASTDAKFEVKACKSAINTNNFFIEVWDNFPTKEGNLKISTADIWVYNVLGWDDVLKEYVPIFTFYLDFYKLKKYVYSLHEEGKLHLREKPINKWYKKVRQVYILLSFNEIKLFMIDPERLHEFCVYKKIISDDVPSDYFIINENER